MEYETSNSFLLRAILIILIKKKLQNTAICHDMLNTNQSELRHFNQIKVKKPLVLCYLI